MTFQVRQLLKSYMLQLTDAYYRYKTEKKRLIPARYRIHSTLVDYQKTRKIQLAITDKPGELLPLISIEEIKKMPDILSGLHPVDVNSINDLFYLLHDNVVEVTIQGDTIQAVNHDGQVARYDVNETFDHEKTVSKRIAFMIGYMQAEKMMRKAYAKKEKYKVVQDNITTLEVLDLETNQHALMNPLDILFSDQYNYFSKEDIVRIGFICGQMSQV